MQRLRYCLCLVLLACALLPPRAACAQDQEAWNAHVQATYVRQVQPAFRSPYAGANSLRGAAGASYSATATAALGLRLGPATELYVDPEVAQGVALSGLVGLAAFPNGELAKTSGASATAYIARAFVRHTIGLGGEREAVEGEANQLKSDYDARRIVLTVGKLSVLDVFDDNAHAHDPRTQFMNWTLMTYGAYDYPADARGYTDGLAAELRDGPWTARLARFAEPRTPNALALDNDLLRHYGDQLELVRAYALAGQPGAVHVLAFRGRALMSTWADALAAAPSGSAPSLAAVRAGSHVKTGIGVNIEQQLRGDVGMFLRALRADGKTETEAFAESDGSFAAGVSVKGGHNVVGAAVGADVLSGAHRSYLERGGMSAFLGDGALRYGSERLAEIFYKLALGEGLELSADCQRIANPGYNMDRGPATFYAIRLHWED